MWNRVKEIAAAVSVGHYNSFIDLWISSLLSETKSNCWSNTYLSLFSFFTGVIVTTAPSHSTKRSSGGKKTNSKGRESSSKKAMREPSVSSKSLTQYVNHPIQQHQPVQVPNHQASNQGFNGGRGGLPPPGPQGPVLNPQQLSLQQLQDMAMRQQNQIEAQQQMLVAKEQRLKYLRQQDFKQNQMAAEYERLRRLREKVSHKWN